MPETETTVASGDTSVGTSSDSRGVKRPAENEDMPPVLEDESERPRGVKRGIDEPNDGMECVFDAEVMDGLWTHEDLCSIVTYPCLVEREFCSKYHVWEILKVKSLTILWGESKSLGSK